MGVYFKYKRHLPDPKSDADSYTHTNSTNP